MDDGSGIPLPKSGGLRTAVYFNFFLSLTFLPLRYDCGSKHQNLANLRFPQ
jgi:hypothetical protein